MAALLWCALVVHAEPSAPSIDFNFDRVEIRTFARLVGEITGRRFVVADGVSGKITVVSPRVRPDEVYPLFVHIIESVGCSVVRDGEIHRIVPLPRGDHVPSPVVGEQEPIPAEGMATKIFRLEHVPAASVQKVLALRLGGENGAVSLVEETNHLLVTDTVGGLREVEKLIGEIDREGLDRVTEVVSLEFVSAEDLARQLNLAVAESESRADALKQRLPNPRPGGQARAAFVVPAADANKLILVGTPSQVAFLKGIIAKMDIDVPSGRGRLNAIFLKYISAGEAATNITALLDRSATAAAAGGRARRIAIEASEANNALLVDASPGDFQVVSDLIDQLDTPREQVHIEVLIAEVSSGEGLDYGVELAALDMPEGVGDTVVQGSSLFSGGAESVLSTVQDGLFPRGISIGAAHGTRRNAEGNLVVSYPGIINIEAVKSDTRFEILSETALEAQNNREASVSIVDEIPILESTIRGGAGTSRDVIQNIKRIEVGIKLSLTPHVIPDGLVQMKLNPKIEAVIETQSSGEQNLTPTIARREVSTTVTVPSGETIVIAGLTRHDAKRTERRVPLLGSIPLLGWLFRQDVRDRQDTDILVFVKPRVLSDTAAVRRMSDEWREKTGISGDEVD